MLSRQSHGSSTSTIGCFANVADPTLQSMFRDTRLGAGGGIKKKGGTLAPGVAPGGGTRRPGNRILAALSGRQCRRVAVDVEQISLVAGQVIYEPGHAI